MSKFITCPCSKFRFVLLTILLTVINAKAAQAQITPDNTLGNEASQVTEATIQSLATDLIEGGAIRGDNLFHSFSDFNVADLQRVYFANPIGIENILSRVTGTSQSSILGTLGVDGNANLFLLNPNGIVFGPEAQLDISGAFFASTADALEFDAGLTYSAINPTAPPLLDITLTPGLQYGQPQQGTIQSEAQLQTGGPLTLQADTLNLQGSLLTPSYLQLWAEDTVEIRDSTLKPFVAAAGDGIDIRADQLLDISILENPDNGLFSGGDLRLRSDQPVIGDAHFQAGGQFQVEQLDGSPGDLISLRDPVIETQGDLLFNTYIGGSLRILAGGSVTINGIIIDGTDPTFPDGQVPLSRILPDGVDTVVVDGSNRPIVDIRAGTTAVQTPFNCIGCSVFNPSDLQTGTATSANINIVSINIIQPNGVVLLTNQFQPNETLTGDIRVNTVSTNIVLGKASDVFIDSRGDIELFPRNVFIPFLGNILVPSTIQTLSLNGDAGRVVLIANGEVAMLESSTIASQIGTIGQGGRIDILANTLQMNELVQISASTTSQQKGGDIYIEVSDSLDMIGDIPTSEIPGARNTSIFSTVGAGATADAGEITIKAGSLTITGGAIIGTFIRPAENGRSAGQGNSGNINVLVEGDIRIDGLGSPANTGFDSSASSGTVGNTGNIRIEGQNLFIQDGRFPAIRTDVLGRGDSGNIEIQLDESLVVSGDSVIATDLREGGVGNAGDIIVDAQNIVVENDAAISSSITPSRLGLPGGQGTGGNIFLKGRDSIVLSRGILQSVAGRDSIGTAGDITLETPNLVVENFSAVATVTFNESQGGDIRIISDQVLVQESSFLSQAEGLGPAGDIEIISDERLTVSAGDISASSDAAGEGDIDIDTGIAFFNQGSLLSTSVFDSTGGGGNITINADALVLLEDSDVLANAEFGPGGIITINSPAFLATLFDSGQATPVGRNPGSFAPFRGNNRVDISADSAAGEAGTVSLPNLVTDEGLNELPIDRIDPSNLIDQRCDLLVSQQTQEDNQFVVIGRGGLPTTPNESLSDESLIEDLGPTIEGGIAYPIIDDSQQTVAADPDSNSDLGLQVISEPQGWARNSEGRLVLYSKAPSANSLNLIKTDCSSSGHTLSSL